MSLASVDLPGAGRTDERDPLPGRDVQRHVVQHRVVVAVCERDVVDVDLAVARGRSTAPVRSVTVGLRVEHAEDLVQRGTRPTAPCCRAG